jgi:hypothetical protein
VHWLLFKHRNWLQYFTSAYILFHVTEGHYICGFSASSVVTDKQLKGSQSARLCLVQNRTTAQGEMLREQSEIIMLMSFSKVCFFL